MSYSVFIIKNNPNTLKQAESYLRNRKWRVGSAVSMREALAYIIQKQPEYVLICADHPNKKIRILPKLLSQAFPVKIIAYTESGSPSALQALREMGQKNTLFPPISGPAIERMVLKVKKQELADAEELKNKNENLRRQNLHDTIAQNELGDIMTFKNETSPSELESSLAQARAALNQLINAKDDEASSAAYMPDQGPSSESKGSGYYIAKGEAANSHSASADASASLEYFSQHSDPNQALAESEANASPGSKRRQIPILESGEIFNRNKRKILYLHGEESRNLKSESLVVQGSIEALDQSVIESFDSDDPKINRIENLTNVACIIVESERFSGYLITALGKNRKIDQSFTEAVKTRLFAFLGANGEIVLSKDSMALSVREVEFEGWALEQAEFLRKTVHEGDEIAMAFFPHDEIKTKFGESASDKMVSLSLDELKADVALEFDLYMYMPENNKYLLYTPQGRPFYGNQKGRLQERGIKQMHLRKESVSDVRKYRAQNFLNDKIENFRVTRGLDKM